MAWFLFAGDMAVMLFMTGLVIWVCTGSSNETVEFSAHIPLEDEVDHG